MTFLDHLWRLSFKQTFHFILFCDTLTLVTWCALSRLLYLPRTPHMMQHWRRISNSSHEITLGDWDVEKKLRQSFGKFSLIFRLALLAHEQEYSKLCVGYTTLAREAHLSTKWANSHLWLSTIWTYMVKMSHWFIKGFRLNSCLVLRVFRNQAPSKSLSTRISRPSISYCCKLSSVVIAI